MRIDAMMADLARRRPVFHSERDFQHALAWLIQQRHCHVEVRLEPKPRPGVHLDLLVRLPGHGVAIELKYLVAAYGGTASGEHFELRNQGAHDISRYDVVKDVVRLERLVADGYAGEGCLVALSNDPAYWRPGTKVEPVDAAFRIHERRRLAGRLAWSATAGPGTTLGREEPLLLAGAYTCNWRPYSTVVADNGRTAEFRYLAINVRTAAQAAEPAPPPRLAQAQAAAAAQPPAFGTTARDEILAAVTDLVRRSGHAEFDLNDVLVEMRRRGSRYSAQTIRTHVVSRMCANAPDHHATTFDDFERVGRGRYRVRRR